MPPQAVAIQNQRALDARFQQNPERFVKGHATVTLPPAFVAINTVTAEDGSKVLADHVNFPTLTAAEYVSDKGK